MHGDEGTRLGFGVKDLVLRAEGLVLRVQDLRLRVKG